MDGDLKVTGTVDANGNPITNVGTALSMTDAINGNVLQSALRDDGVYEYKFVLAKFGNAVNPTISTAYCTAEYKDLDAPTFSPNFNEYLNQLILDGWSISYHFGTGTNYSNDIYMVVYELRRPVSDD